ncbi:MAG: molybdopterin-dependent oxidoreductase [Ktedonobacteraceae bacterium]
MTATKTSYITCPLCEATCGLEVITQGSEVLSIKGDSEDVFSKGHICPKAYGMKELDADPDRVREPMIRRDGQWQTVSWHEAFTEIERGLTPLLKKHGRNALAVYAGNPNAHNLSSLLYLPVMLRAAGTQNIYSATSVDQLPKQVSTALMFGTPLSVAVPDLERTEYLLLLGANPLISNGSLLTAPDMRGRLRRLRARGGKLIVIDPYRTRTAQEADEHHCIRPGYDAHFLFALVHTLFAENLVNPGRLAEHTAGIEQVGELAQHFSPEQVAGLCGIDADTIRTIARALASTPHAAVYGRIGTCTQEFGTLASWLVDVLNTLTGNLDREGGAMFPKAAAGARNTSGLSGKGRATQVGRWKSRVRGLPELFGELPVVCLAEEIATPGDGQVKALITVAGNPVLSTPNSQRLQESLEKLDFMVSVDMFLNETTRYANVILPPPPTLARSHYDIVFYQLATHNVANYSTVVIEREQDALEEWEVLLKLAAILMGQDVDATVVDDVTIRQLVKREVATKGSPIQGRDVSEIVAALQPRRGPERMLDFMLRTGPYGDGFNAQQDGLSLATLEANPHGVDLGPLQPRIPEILRTPSGKIELAPAIIVADVERLQASLTRTPGQMLLIGRRDLRSNNSWMHNIHALTKGKDRCTLHMHPDDATRLNVANGETACVASRVGSVEVPVEITDAIMPGVVSIPHGWGHTLSGTQQHIAIEHAGVNTNILTDEEAIDVLSGNAALNGVAVKVEKKQMAYV